MAEYTTDAADALAQIKDAGRQVVVRRLSRTANPALGTTTVTAAGGKLDVVLLPLRRGELLDDTLVEAFVRGKLRKLLVAAASAPLSPQSLDVVLFEGAYWVVRGGTTLKPATLPLLYTVVVENTDLSAADVAALNLSAEEQALAAA